jgi:hypothetical protein
MDIFKRGDEGHFVVEVRVGRRIFIIIDNNIIKADLNEN